MPDCFVAYVTDLTASGARFETSQKFEFALALVTRRLFQTTTTSNKSIL